MTFEQTLAEPRLAATRWSVAVHDVARGEVVFEHHPRRLLRTASVGKVFLLLEVAERLVRGELRGDLPVRRDSVAPVADSGLWQHLSTDSLPIEDAAVLVGAVSDNWATNALLDLVGLDAVRARASRTVPGGSTLHDLVRDVREPDDPATLSEGCAGDWAELFAGLHTGEAADPDACLRVLGWLGTGVDLSMVASAFGLDPLAHSAPDRGVSVWSKTGTSDGVRADVGLVRTDRDTWSYAALCNWDPAEPSLREPVLAAMRGLGGEIARRLGVPVTI